MALQKGFLGEAAARLARALGQEGLISPKFESGEKLIPTVLVADATGLGMGSNRGRRFYVNVAGGPTPNGPMLRLDPAAPEGLIIESAIVALSAATTVTLNWAFGVAAGVTANSCFVDRAQNAPERVPLLTSANVAALGGMSIPNFLRISGVSTPQITNFPFFLTPGMAIQFFSVTAGTIEFTLIGRTF